MRCSKGHKQPKKLPYGAVRSKCWCVACDGALIPPEPNKKRERKKAKDEIKSDMD